MLHYQAGSAGAGAGGPAVRRAHLVRGDPAAVAGAVRVVPHTQQVAGGRVRAHSDVLPVTVVCAGLQERRAADAVGPVVCVQRAVCDFYSLDVAAAVARRHSLGMRIHWDVCQLADRLAAPRVGVQVEEEAGAGRRARLRLEQRRAVGGAPARQQQVVFSAAGAVQLGVLQEPVGGAGHEAVGGVDEKGGAVAGHHSCQPLKVHLHGSRLGLVPTKRRYPRRHQVRGLAGSGCGSSACCCGSPACCSGCCSTGAGDAAVLLPPPSPKMPSSQLLMRVWLVPCSSYSWVERADPKAPRGQRQQSKERRRRSSCPTHPLLRVAGPERLVLLGAAPGECGADAAGLEAGDQGVCRAGGSWRSGRASAAGGKRQAAGGGGGRVADPNRHRRCAALALAPSCTHGAARRRPPVLPPWSWPCARPGGARGVLSDSLRQLATCAAIRRAKTQSASPQHDPQHARLKRKCTKTRLTAALINHRSYHELSPSLRRPRLPGGRGLDFPSTLPPRARAMNRFTQLYNERRARQAREAATAAAAAAAAGDDGAGGAAELHPALAAVPGLAAAAPAAPAAPAEPERAPSSSGGAAAVTASAGAMSRAWLRGLPLLCIAGPSRPASSPLLHGPLLAATPLPTSCPPPSSNPQAAPLPCATARCRSGCARPTAHASARGCATCVRRTSAWACLCECLASARAWGRGWAPCAAVRPPCAAAHLPLHPCPSYLQGAVRHGARVPPGHSTAGLGA